MLYLACILLVAFTSTAEVAHAHRIGLLPAGKVANSRQASAADSHCSICLAAHSPALTTKPAAPVPFTRRETELLPARPHSRSRLSIFALTVRPPPSPQVSAVNLTNKVALYNFLSTFSGTHFVTPRTYQAQLTFRF